MNVPIQIDDRKLSRLANKIAARLSRSWTVMEICGGLTRTFLEYNLSRYLPQGLEIVHGPGCAVCAAPKSFIDAAIEIASLGDVIFCASGDFLNLTGSRCDLLELKAGGADIRVKHSPLDSLQVARDNPEKKVVYLSIGFGQTAQLNALALWQAKRIGLRNYFLLASHGFVPAVVQRVLQEPDRRVDAVIGLGNICSVTGLVDFEPISRNFGVPFVITGFSPMDLMEGIEIVVDMLESGQNNVENQYISNVRRDGNREARALIHEVFELVDRDWRGLGPVPLSGYRLKPEFQQFDASLRFKEFFTRENGKTVTDVSGNGGLYSLRENGSESRGCISRDIQLGFKKPLDCPHFGNACNPRSALGATMVSSDGACASYYQYR